MELRQHWLLLLRQHRLQQTHLLSILLLSQQTLLRQILPHLLQILPRQFQQILLRQILPHLLRILRLCSQQILLRQILPHLLQILLRRFQQILLLPNLPQPLLLRLHPRLLPQPSRLFTSMPAASGSLLSQLYALKVLPRAVSAQMWVLTTVAEREENHAGGHHAQEVEEEILHHHLLRHHLPRLHLLILLLLVDVQLVPMDPAVSAVALVLTVESPATEAASRKGYAEFARRSHEYNVCDQHIAKEYMVEIV